MVPKLFLRSSLLVLLGFLASGCRAHPVSLGMMLIGDAINDSDVKDRAGELLGNKVDAADQMFGERLETFDDTRRLHHEVVVYPVKGDLLGSSRYVVEVRNARIISLSKSKHNIDGIEDVVKGAALGATLVGKNPEACARDGDLGPPILVLRHRGSGNLVRCYDVRNITNSRGARNCVLRFDANDLCTEVKYIGVSATTDPDLGKG